MIKFLNLIVLFSFLIFSPKLFANEMWEFVKDTEYCYIQSIPVETKIPEGKMRGKHGILVYRMHKDPQLFVQITAGFDYKSSDSIIVKIDDNNYSFYTDEDTAWAEEDKKVINAMRRGLSFITTGVSGKGTKVTDIYTLKGFTSAVNKLTKDC